MESQFIITLMKKTKLSVAQKRIVNALHGDSFILASVTSTGGEWDFRLAKPIRGIHSIMKNGILMKVGGFFETHKPPYCKAQETIRCLIHKKVLVSPMSDKEFAVQVALGTIERRVYKLAWKYR